MPRQRRSPLVLAILAATVPALALVGLVSAGLTWNRVRTFHDHELCVIQFAGELAAKPHGTTGGAGTASFCSAPIAAKK